MTFIRIISILLLGLTSTVGAVAAPETNRFSAMTIEDAKEIIREPLSGQETQELIDAVLESERLDLAKVAWVRLGARIRNNVDALPYSRCKEDVLLMMLQTDCGYWPDTITYGSRGIISTTKPFTSLIQRYLPEVKPSVSLLESRQARLRLVAQIEHARGAEAAAQREEERQKEALPPPSPSPATPTPSNAAATSATPTPILASKSTGKSELWLWITAAIGAAAAAAALLVLRRRQKHTGPH